MNLIVVNGQNTLIHSEPLAIIAPIDQNRKVKSAIICEGSGPDFHTWQDVTYYFHVEFTKAAMMQKPGVDLSNCKILVLLE